MSTLLVSHNSEWLQEAARAFTMFQDQEYVYSALKPITRVFVFISAVPVHQDWLDLGRALSYNVPVVIFTPADSHLVNRNLYSLLCTITTKSVYLFLAEEATN